MKKLKSNSTKVYDFGNGAYKVTRVFGSEKINKIIEENISQKNTASKVELKNI